MYVAQAQSAGAAEHGLIASEISEIAELQRLLGITTRQLEDIAETTSAIGEDVSKIEHSVAAVDERVASVDNTLEGIEQSASSIGEDVSKIEHSVTAVDERVASVDSTLAGIKQEASTIGADISRFEQSVSAVGESLENLEDIGDTLGNIKLETSSDPRKELANMGMQWKYEYFLDALRNADERAIKLYLEGGMKLKSDGFADFVTDIYSKPVMDMLVAANALEGDFACPGNISFYKKISNFADKASFVNSVCNTQLGKLLRKLDKQIDEQQAILDADRLYNTQLEQDRKQCVEDLRNIETAEYVAGVENYDYASPASTRKTVLSSLKSNSKMLKILAYKNVNPEKVQEATLNKYYQDIESDITEVIAATCLAAYPEDNKKIIHTDKLEQLSKERKLLTGSYTIRT